MSVTDDLLHLENAIKWQQAQNVSAIIEGARSRIDRLENDVKVLRWALHRAREALTHSGSYSGVIDLIQTAENMTGPANDR